MKYFLLVFCLLAAPAEASVVASIKPLHSLVAAVMAGDGMPLLLVDGKASPHDFSLKPSQMQVLEKADIVFYMGDNFEVFLGHVLAALPENIERVTMEKAPGMTLYPLRVSGNFAPDDDDVGDHDLHLWMSPANAKVMVAEIERRLSEKYPQKKTLYHANAAKLNAKLDVLDAELKPRMAALKDKPFVVFHDAYQYFEKAYGLDDVGAITLNPARAPGAKHMSELRAKIRKTGATCVFREPEFEPKIVDNLLEGTNVKSGMLDPEGVLLTPGPQLYFQLMQGIAGGLERCLLP